MADQNSSKKIQRAARAAAATRSARERRRLGFPAVVAAVMILGVGMVVMSRNSRPAAEPPRRTDHWHSAYGVYDCDRFLDHFTSSADPDGIHSHQDGVIHIHPWNSSATGQDARLQVFFESMGVKVTEEEISGPGIGVLKAGSDCRGQPTVIRAARFSLPPDFDGVGLLAASNPEAAIEEAYEKVDEYTDSFGDIRLLSDLEAFTIARVPVDADIVPPPTIRLLQAFNSSAGGLLSTGPNASATPPILDTTPLILDTIPQVSDEAPTGDGARGGEAPADAAATGDDGAVVETTGEEPAADTAGGGAAEEPSPSEATADSEATSIGDG